MFLRAGVCLAASAAVMIAGGGGSKPANPAPPAANSGEVRILSELVPAGGTAQIKFSLTNPQPIFSGGTKFASWEGMRTDGVALWGPVGDEAGAAVLRNGVLQIEAISPSADLGTLTDYPFLTITAELPSSAQSGSRIPLTLDASTSLLTSAGQLAVTMKPGTLQVGGNFSIHGVTPGGGTYPAGTDIRIDGKGFLPGAQLKTPQMKISSFKVVSSTEIDFTLKEQTTLDAQMVQVVNPGGFVQSYYSYLRGQPLRDPSTAFLKSTEPIFQRQTHALAQIASLGASEAGQYTALALQNPNPGPAVATLMLTHSDGGVLTTAILLPSGSRITDSIAGLFGVSDTQTGDRVDVVCTSAIQILGMNVDENAGTVMPFLPTF